MTGRVETILRSWAEPDPRFSPAPLWWWSGERLEVSRLRQQMDAMLAMGIRQVVIINLAPSGTLFGSDADDPPFLSEPWWDLFAQVCDHARAIGMLIWFYDQIGFSGASYQAEIAAAHPECLARQLARVTVEGTGDLRLQCPVLGTPLGAYVVQSDAPATPADVEVRGRGAHVHAGRPSRLCLVYTLAQGYDLFSPTACERLLDAVHRQFERRLPQHLGTTIIGSFQDELPDLPTWGTTFADTFAEARGYRLEDRLHHLFEGDTTEARVARRDYHAHRAALAERAFFKPFFGWHERRGLQCGFDQQSPAREARVVGCTAKYADYLRTQRWYAIPGSDLHGNGKLHASIAFLYDRPRVWIEGFHSTGWGGTIADTFDWLLPYLRSGANFYNPHAIYYSTRGGWWEWAPPSTCWRQPYGRDYRAFADLIARLTGVISIGVHQADVAVLFPTGTVQANLPVEGPLPAATLADETLHGIMGSVRWHQARTGVLDEAGLDYHLIDEETLAIAEIRDASLVHRGVAMRTLILPAVTSLDGGAWKAVAAFASAGGRVIAVNADEVEVTDGHRVSLRSLPGCVQAASPGELAAALADVRRTIRSPLPTLHRKDGDLNVLFVPAVNGMATRVKWDNWFAPMERTTLDPARYWADMEVVLPATARRVWNYDPRTGTAPPVVTTGPAERTVRVDFGGSPFAVLVWSDADDGPPAAAESRPPLARHDIRLPELWRSVYEATESLVPSDVPVDRRLPHTTDLQWYQGLGEPAWRNGIPRSVDPKPVRTTFGVRAWQRAGQSANWTPISYSPLYGIQQDPLHTQTLGPKGYVPDEFVELGKLTRGEEVTVRTGVHSVAPRSALLAVGANAIKSADVNGERLAAAGPEYLWIEPVNLRQGENTIDLRLTASRDGTVRLFWCLLDPGSADRFRRPERIAAADPVVAGDRLVYQRTFDLAHATEGGLVKLSVAAMASVAVDDAVLGRQGGFDPYRPMMRGQTCAVPALSPGRHSLRVELLQPERPAPVLVDCALVGSGGNTVSIGSDCHWTVSVEGRTPTTVAIHDRPEADGGAWLLHRRPHPLPRAWQPPGIPTSPGSPVLDLPSLPPAREPEPQWFEWILPPGVVHARVPLVDCREVGMWVEGVSVEISSSGEVDLAATAPTGCRKAVLFVACREAGGGVFLGPISYRFGRGLSPLGSWLDQGLRSYSGAMRLTTEFDAPAGTAPVTLDLGHVRGTVEAIVNGRSAGACVIAPYRFDLGPFVRPGENELTLRVTNTLANHLSTWSPTRWWSPDQLESGIFGPVTLSAFSPAEHLS
jgi:hypothetical protein